MNILRWNCRGLENLRAATVLSHLVREKAANVLFLMETKQTVDEMRKTQADLKYDSMLAVPCVHRAGGLAMLWKKEVSLDIQTYSLNHTDACIMTDLNSPWRLTGFYGRPEEHRKHEKSYLRHLHSRDSLPWLCIGDYNEILNSNEKQGRIPRPFRPMEEFRTTLAQCGLSDLGFQGNIFTWRNGRPGDDFVQERLDRACATLEWRDLFPQAKVKHIQAAYSDHNPISLSTQVTSPMTKRKKIPKRFEEKWSTHPECELIILEAWNASTEAGSPMYRLFNKIKRCRMSLVEWSRTLGNSKALLDDKYNE